jgi:hypothetical protein
VCSSDLNLRKVFVKLVNRHGVFFLVGFLQL